MKPVLRIKGLLSGPIIDIPVGHRWVEDASQKKLRATGAITFLCRACDAVFFLQYNAEKGAPKWMSTFQYTENSCIESEAILAQQSDDI
jgi:hypothetical protein